MSQRFFIRKLEEGQITIETAGQPGDISLLFDVTTPEVDAVRNNLRRIVEVDVLPIQPGLKSV